MAYGKCPKEGIRVRFVPNPAAAMFYTGAHEPRRGEFGTTVALPVPGGKKTCMPGPRGGLVYVDWDGAGVSGAFKRDIEREDGFPLQGVGCGLWKKTRRRSKARR